MIYLSQAQNEGDFKSNKEGPPPRREEDSPESQELSAIVKYSRGSLLRDTPVAGGCVHYTVDYFPFLLLNNPSFVFFHKPKRVFGDQSV